jgi:hypothetical protein
MQNPLLVEYSRIACSCSLQDWTDGSGLERGLLGILVLD